MFVDVLMVMGLLATGLAVGVLFGVALANVPGFAALPVDRYVQVHQLFDQRYEPTMPLLVLGAAAIDVLAAVLVEETPRRVLLLGAAVLLAGVALVSPTRNVPLLHPLRRVDASALPDTWHDPRPQWRQWHLVRTGLGLAAFVVATIAFVA